ncbi:MAG: hypothetical protein N4A38_03655 [Candidatus Gracilibacteria bacterium]|nr:hypothetical protein [Candidatus Gracilibacteria bacterium]
MNKNIIKAVLILLIIVGGFFAIKTIQNNVESNPEIQNEENKIAGYWFTPHNAGENITFNTDKTFVYNHNNLDTEKEEKLNGTYSLNNSELTLTYSNGKEEKLSYVKGEGEDNNYYIQNTDKTVYLVKGKNNL